HPNYCQSLPTPGKCMNKNYTILYNLRLPSHFGTQQYFLFPFIEQQDVYMSPEINCSPGAPGNPVLHGGNSWWSHVVISTYIAPSDPSVPVGGAAPMWDNRGMTSYAANWHSLRGRWGDD